MYNRSRRAEVSAVPMTRRVPRFAPWAALVGGIVTAMLGCGEGLEETSLPSQPAGGWGASGEAAGGAPARAGGAARGARALGDPLSDLAWVAEGDGAGIRLGRAVASAGDVDGDGYSDVVVGAPAHGGPAGQEGRVDVYLGSPSGPGAAPDWTASGGQHLADFGDAVAGAGDVDGDGYDDVIVGASQYDGGYADEGRVVLFRGGAAGLEAVPAWSAEGGEYRAGFGFSVAGAGDVNGDGYDDVIVGAPGHDGGYADQGMAVLYLGSAAGLGAAPAWTAVPGQAQASFGWAVAGAGDVNGDGYDDVIVGAPYADGGATDEGMAYLYLGGAGGLEASPSWVAGSGQAYANFGWSVSSAGDVDGDGYGDVVVGAPFFQAVGLFEGRISVYAGGPAGLPAVASWTADAGAADRALGYSVAGPGDVDADGYDDVVAGAPYTPGAYYHGEGYAALYSGSAGGIPALPSWWGRGAPDGHSYHGTSVAGAGDVDGDGKADVVVGAPEWSGPLGAEGRAALYLGGGICKVLDWYADVDLDGFGDPGAIASACVVPAGYVADDTDCDDADPGIYPGAPEVCGDGVDGDCLGAASGCVLEGDLSASAADVYLVGEQGGDRAGHAVAHADLDGDGYQDVLVGAPGYPGGLSAGALYVVYGPVWGTIDLSLADARIEGEAAGDLAGYSVAGAGDLDGDGNEDVLVGAPGVGVVGGKEGAAYVLYGPLTGTGSLATAGAKMTGEAMGDGAGTAVAGAGDVNGDGSPDLAVGAPFYDGRGVDSGAAYLVLGPVWGVMDLSLADATLMGPRRGEQAGWSLAGGDFDGDGRGDLLVGAPGSRAGGPGSGAAYLARGPVLGRRNLGTVAAATLVGEGPQDQAGWSVASAGDVDGDGADDVLVGARRFDGGGTDAGAAYLLAGSPTGTIDLSLADASLTGYVSLDLAGAAVRGGGDADMDGVADLAVAAPLHDSAGPSAGVVFVLYGTPAGPFSLARSDLYLHGERPQDQLGHGIDGMGGALAWVGDVDLACGDDLLVGSPRHDAGGTDAGAAWLLYSRCW